MKKRNLSGAAAPPILIALVPLHQNIDLDKVLNLLISADDQAIVRTSSCGTTHIRYKIIFLVLKILIK